MEETMRVTRVRKTALVPAALIVMAAELVTGAAGAAASGKRGVTSEDYFAFQSISDAHISPDGKQAAYVLTTVDQKRNRRDNSSWVVATDGRSAPRRLTAEGFNSDSPRWSPDGSRLAFLSTRTAQSAEPAEAPRPQIYILRLDGGEAQALTHLKNGAGVFQW